MAAYSEAPADPNAQQAPADPNAPPAAADPNAPPAAVDPSAPPAADAKKKQEADAKAKADADRKAKLAKLKGALPWAAGAVGLAGLGALALSKPRPVQRPPLGKKGEDAAA